MKISTILYFTIAGFIVISGVPAIGQQGNKTTKEQAKVVSAKKELKEAKDNLREARLDSAADFKAFKMNAEVKIQENKAEIIKLRADNQKNDMATKEKYDKQIMALEQKNSNLDKRIKDANFTKTTMWTSFKREFTHDMDELGHAFKDVSVNNIK